MVAANGFVEWAHVHNYRYGTSKRAIEERMAQGADVILEIDWQGARQVRERLPEAISIFILPPSLPALQLRLESRRQDGAEVIQERMRQAVGEMSHYGEADYLVVNDDFDRALADLHLIVQAERLRLQSQSSRLRELLTELLSGP